MGTVNGLESGDFGPDINTQRLILPAGRQWEKDMRGGGEKDSQRRPAVGESEGLSVLTKQSKLGEEGAERAEEALDLPPDCRNTSGEEHHYNILGN